MEITLLASTQLRELPKELENTPFITDMSIADMQDNADVLAHMAGRACYQSWNKPNPATSTNAGYLRNILKQNHFSVLEHATATFYVTGVSRNMTHELVRHRHLSYSELSQRYVDMKDAEWIVPPALRNSPLEEIPDVAVDFENYSNTVDHLTTMGYSRKQAREAARFYLPSGMETKIVVTGNHRAWRDMLNKRYSVHADAEIREFATKILGKLREIAPATYQDFPETPFE